MALFKGKYLLVYFLLISVAVNIYYITKGSSHLASEGETKEANEVIEVADLMFYFQHYANKLYFAGINQNQSLVDFYLHELKEKTEIFQEVEVVDDGKNISLLMKQLFIPVLDSFRTQPFDQAYSLMVTRCNQCHEAAGYPFIRIVKPVQPAFWNQDYQSRESHEGNKK
jgi:hypothetical protein